MAHRRGQIIGMLVIFLLAALCVLSPAQAEKITYFNFDALGSPLAASDEAGNLLWREDYRPYGARIRNEDDASNIKWYTGKPHDEDTGLTYFGARYYNPVVGRFMGVDPVDFQEENIHSFNKYAYANNNPYKYVDPDGRYVDLVVEGASIAVGTASLTYNLDQGNYVSAAVDALGIAGDFGLALVPGVPGAIGLSIKASRESAEIVLKKVPDITTPYKRPSGTTTKAQRESVQGKPCVDCGATMPKQYADHKDPLVKEYYRNGTVDKTRMREIDAVQPQCPTCSSKQGAEMSRFSRQQKKDRGL